MKTRINSIHGDWTNIKNKCRTTVNKAYSASEPGSGFKTKLLLAEHSPIRLLEVDWSWESVPYWVSTEWSRHKWEKFISTQRTDRTGRDRDCRPQSAPVNFDGVANAQSLIDTWRKRLCCQAANEARGLAEDFKIALEAVQPELSQMLVPNCIYRCGCPEFQMCRQRYFETFVKMHPGMDITDIQKRYEAYRNDLLKRRKAVA